MHCKWIVSLLTVPRAFPWEPPQPLVWSLSLLNLLPETKNSKLSLSQWEGSKTLINLPWNAGKEGLPARVRARWTMVTIILAFLYNFINIGTSTAQHTTSTTTSTAERHSVLAKERQSTVFEASLHYSTTTPVLHDLT